MKSSSIMKEYYEIICASDIIPFLNKLNIASIVHFIIITDLCARNQNIIKLTTFAKAFLTKEIIMEENTYITDHYGERKEFTITELEEKAGKGAVIASDYIRNKMRELGISNDEM